MQTYLAVVHDGRLYHVSLPHMDEIWCIYKHAKSSDTLGYTKREVTPNGHLAWQIRKTLRRMRNHE